MIGLEPILAHVVPFTLVLFRVLGLFLFTPLLANRTVPRRFRLMLGVMFAAAIYPALPPAAMAVAPATMPELAAMVVGEILLGMVLGFLAALPLVALDLAGFIMGHQMGMGLARVYNPEANSDTDILGQLLMYIGLACFVALDGLEVMFIAVTNTFGRVPPGGLAAAEVPLDAMVAVLAAGLELAMRIAAPAVAIIFLIMVALGVISKTMPQLNVMTIGFTIKIIAGLAMLAVALGAAHAAVHGHIEQVLREIVGWSARLGAG